MEEVNEAFKLGCSVSESLQVKEATVYEILNTPTNQRYTKIKQLIGEAQKGVPSWVKGTEKLSGIKTSLFLMGLYHEIEKRAKTINET